MANEQNLKKFGKDKPPLTHEEAVKQGKTGGKASGEARAKAKTSREIVELLDSLPVTENNNAIMETLGIPEICGRGKRSDCFSYKRKPSKGTRRRTSYCSR